MSFGFHSTTDEVLAGCDLDGEVAVVTGGSGGLGEETVRCLAAHGAHVVMAARDRAKADAARERILARHPSARVEWLPVELAELDSVRALADRILDRHPQVHRLFNNAGIMAGPRRGTAEGFEAQLGVNHLAHFVLTSRLAPALVAGAAGREGAARIVNTSSQGHRFGGFDLDDLLFERRPYSGFAGYGQSKMANILHAVELDRRLAGTGVRAASAHPGGIKTELGRSFTPEDRAEMATLFTEAEGGAGFEYKSTEAGAATQVWAGVVAPPAEVGGRYCEDCQVSEVDDRPQRMVGGVLSAALDPGRARALWERSEELTGERWPS